MKLSWKPMRRGLHSFLIELTEDAAGLTGWRMVLTTRKSSVALTGLTSGRRYFFRVTAQGAAGPGSPGDPAVKTAP